MKLFKNRTVLGIFCIAVSLIICFAITPLVKQPYGTGAWLCFLSDSPQQGSRNTVSGGRYAGRTWTKREQGI